MRLSISNLALPDGYTDWTRLREAGVEGVEVAPTRIAAWDELNRGRVEAFRRTLTDSGLVVSSLQAIFFGVPDIALLEEPASFNLMKEHMKRVGEVGALLGAKVAVFGAPKQRSRGKKTEQDAFDLGAERLQQLAEILHKHGLVIGLEPVPSAYNGDFLTIWQDVDAMVRYVDHPALKVHLDTGCVFLGEGRIAEAIAETHDVLAHFHIAEPLLTGFSTPTAEHAESALALIEANYRGWLAIEMLRQESNPLAAVAQAIEFATCAYRV